MTCRLGGSELQMKGRRRRHRGAPAPVTQLLFVTLPPAASCRGEIGYEHAVADGDRAAGLENALNPEPS